MNRISARWCYAGGIEIVTKPYTKTDLIHRFNFSGPEGHL